MAEPAGSGVYEPKMSIALQATIERLRTQGESAGLEECTICLIAFQSERMECCRAYLCGACKSASVVDGRCPFCRAALNKQ